MLDADLVAIKFTSVMEFLNVKNVPYVKFSTVEKLMQLVLDFPHVQFSGLVARNLPVTNEPVNRKLFDFVSLTLAYTRERIMYEAGTTCPNIAHTRRQRSDEDPIPNTVIDFVAPKVNEVSVTVPDVNGNLVQVTMTSLTGAFNTLKRINKLDSLYGHKKRFLPWKCTWTSFWLY